MDHYKEMYLRLFNATTIAMEQLEQSASAEKVITLLKESHQDCEEFFMEHCEE